MARVSMDLVTTTGKDLVPMHYSITLKWHVGFRKYRSITIRNCFSRDEALARALYGARKSGFKARLWWQFWKPGPTLTEWLETERACIT